MNRDLFLELEKTFFKTLKREDIAADNVADILGVLIDLKPAMAADFGEDDFKNLDFEHFKKLIADLGLKIVFLKRPYKSAFKEEMLCYYFISKDETKASSLCEQFVFLWESIDEKGNIKDKGAWVDITLKIGRLLGYPETATEEFVRLSDEDIMSETRRARMGRNRYYSHSAEYENEEFESYDKKLNQAIENYAPMTAKVLKAKTDKRWLD